MIRTTSYTIKFSNENKKVWIETLMQDYQISLSMVIDMVLNKELPLKTMISSKEIPTLNNIQHSRWKQVIYKNASEIIRSQIKRANNKRYSIYKKLYKKCKDKNIHSSFTSKKFKELNLNSIIYTKYFTKPNIKNIKIMLDQRLVDIQQNDNEFDMFVKITLPYFFENKKRAMTINIPLKEHKHSLKFKTWNRKKSIQLSNDNLKMFFQNKNAQTQNSNNKIGVDIGYKKLLVTSTKNIYGQQLIDVYKKLTRQVQGSKNFKQTLIYRNNLTNQFCNELNRCENFDELIIENLKNVKHKSKFHRGVNNKLQRWSYPKVINKLERLSEEEGFLLTKINPAYTSQLCSKCGEHGNRLGEFFSCSCGNEMDADINAAINILHRGAYSPSTNHENIFL